MDPSTTTDNAIVTERRVIVERIVQYQNRVTIPATVETDVPIFDTKIGLLPKYFQRHRRTQMPVKSRYSMILLALGFAGLSTGCHHTPKGSTQFDANGSQGSVAVVADNLVELDLPIVRVEKGTIYISGTVHRRTVASEALPGRVDIEFLGPGGEYLDGLPALLTPRAVPADPNTPATYSTSYGYVPPGGSTVRVHFVDRDTQIREDLEGNDFSYSAGGGKGAKGGGGAEPNSNGTHRVSSGTGGGFGSGFGSHRF